MLAIETGLPMADLASWTLTDIETAWEYLRERNQRG